MHQTGLSPHLQKPGTYRTISLMNIIAKILNNILENWIQKHIKKSCTLIMYTSFQRCRGLFSQIWKYKYMKICQCHLPYKQPVRKQTNIWSSISSDTKKVFEKSNYPSWESLGENRDTGTYLNILKVLYSRLTANIKINGEKFTAILLKLGGR